MTDDEELGRQARRVVRESVHYAPFREMPVEQAEKLFLPPEAPAAALQMPSPLTARRLAFRRGWAMG